MNIQFKKNIILGLIFISISIFGTQVVAENHYQMYMNDHNEAIRTLINSWANGGSNDELSRASLDIIAAELSIAGETKSFVSEGSVMHLSNDVMNPNGYKMNSEYDFPVFAYRVFKHKVNKTMGYQPKVKALFENQQFEIYSR